MLLLDTRFHRDDHAVPSVGAAPFPLATVIAAAGRSHPPLLVKHWYTLAKIW